MIIVRPMTKVSSTPEITGVSEVASISATISQSLTLPAADVGDLRVVMVSYYNTVANTVSGWDVVGSITSNWTRMAAISRRKQAGDSDTISLTFSGGTYVGAKAWTIANGGSATWVGATATSTAHPTPAIGTTTKNNVILRSAFSTAGSYTWSSGPTPYADIVAGTRRMATAFQMSQAIENFPIVNVTAPSSSEYAVASIAVGTYFVGPTTAQKGSLTTSMIGVPLNVDNEIGPWTAAGTHPGTVLVGNAYRITNGGRATVSLNVTRGNFVGTMTIRLWIDGVNVATAVGGANASNTVLNSVPMDLEDGTLMTATFQSTSNFSGSNNVTAATLEITPV